MITRNDYDNGSPPDHDEAVSTAHQRSPRTDPDMRDGDSGRGNPGETDAGGITTDNDVGDTAPSIKAATGREAGSGSDEPAAAEAGSVPAGSAEVVRTRAESTERGAVEPHGPAVMARGEERAGESRGDGGRGGPAGASPARKEEYERLVERFEEEGRYGGREEEVAARIVNKQRREFGETRETEDPDQRGQAPNLPIAGYQRLTVPEIIRQAGSLSIDQLREVKDYEKSHRRRKTLLTKLERMLRTPPAGGREGERVGGEDRDSHPPHRS